MSLASFILCFFLAHLYKRRLFFTHSDPYFIQYSCNIKYQHNYSSYRLQKIKLHLKIGNIRNKWVKNPTVPHKRNEPTFLILGRQSEKYLISDVKKWAHYKKAILLGCVCENWRNLVKKQVRGETKKSCGAVVEKH